MTTTNRCQLRCQLCKTSALLIALLWPGSAQQPNPVPDIISITPSLGIAGESPIPVLVRGGGFTKDSVVQFNGSSRHTQYRDGSLNAMLAAADLAHAGQYEITVVNPEGGGRSRPAVFVVNNAVPVVVSASPLRAVAGSASVSVTVNGAGFSADSKVIWNGVEHSPTFTSAVFLTFTASALDLAAAGSALFFVRNPAPAGGDSRKLLFLIPLAVRVNDLAWDPNSGRILMSFPQSAPSPDSSTIQFFDPRNGLFGGKVNVGRDPGRMAVSGNGAALFVGLDGESAIVRLRLPSLAKDYELPIGTLPDYSHGPLSVEDLAVAPGQSELVAASLKSPGSPHHAGVAVFDRKGRRFKVTPGYFGSNLIGFGGDPDVLYGLSTESGENGFRRMVIASEGVTIDRVVGNSRTNIEPPFGWDFSIIGGRAFFGTGLVAAPDTGEKLAALGVSGVMAHNPRTSTLYLLTGDSSYPNRLQAFDTDTLEKLGSITLETAPESVGRFITWGERGLAFHSANSVYVLGDPFEPTPLIAIEPKTVLNGASFMPGPVAPGLLIVLYGEGLGPLDLIGGQPDGNGVFPLSLAGTRVTFDGVPAPVIYTSWKQIAAMVPYAVAGRKSTQIQVSSDGVLTPPLSVSVVATAPAIFSADGSGQGQGAVLNGDGGYNSTVNPARPGSVVVLYATGGGSTIPPSQDGRIATDVLPAPLAHVTAWIGGREARVEYAGAAPGIIAGVMQINLRIPQEVPAGDSVPVIVQIGEMASPTGITVAVR